MRKIFGLGYMGFLLTWVPYLRAMLLVPFKDSLLADANLDSFDPNAYFRDSHVRLKTSGQSQAITAAITEIKGQIILDGESGLGKTMFLRHLVQCSKRPVAYLPATKCARGVLEAIQAKLHGYAKDETFLRSLIYSGAIDVCIDGLNEVSPDTRAQVATFMESNFKGNILLGTQPLEWTPPATARIYLLEPLTKKQIEAFLLSRKDVLPADAQIKGEEYKRACRDYLAWALAENQPCGVLEVTQRVLCNSMDLTVVAWMIAQREKLDLFHLERQQYRLMADDYKRVNVSQEFPLKPFSEQLYQMRMNDEAAIPEQAFQEELRCMERHKMVLRRQVLDDSKQTTEWHFRHDRIMDFFIVQTFLGTGNERPHQHLGDTRFRGVYFQLAALLPFHEAEALREFLIDYAADTKDHTVSDTFIQLLRSRRAT
ncbi:MAG: sigma 54-interacting transcriptional regulator [Gammaproteobacteria bacterium]